MERNNNNTVISAPSIEGRPATGADVVISDEDYSALAAATAKEQGYRLRCWDIQEAIDAQKQNLAQLQKGIDEAEVVLSTSRNELAAARQELKTIFDGVFGPLGLADKHVSVTQESPHVVTVVEAPQE